MKGLSQTSLYMTVRKLALSRPRRAFTLVELMVSLAILVGMMAMVAMIFSTAGKASGKAQASANVQRELQQVVDSIRRDLEAMQPGTGPLTIMGIARVDISAKETPDSATPTTRRADVLMVMTPREFTPYVYQPGAGDSFAMFKHVVYGHANMGNIDPSSFIMQPQTLIEGDPSPIPASDWHLARRIVGSPAAASLTGNNTATWPLTAEEFTGENRGPNDFADVHQLSFALFPGISATGLTGLYKYAYDPGGSSPPSIDSYYCVDKSGNKYHYEDGEYFLLDEDPSAPGWLFWWRRLPSGMWTRTQPGPPVPPNPGPVDPPPPVSVFDTMNTRNYWPEWFYHGGLDGATRVFLDPSPPAGQPERLAAYFLPHCSEFKVEFTYDNPREIAIGDDPGDTLTYGKPILNLWRDLNGDGSLNALIDSSPAPIPIKWESVPEGQQWVWSGLSVTPSDYPVASGDLRDLTHPFRWPKAVRITIRAYGPGAGLDSPITHTIVHTWD